MNYCGECGHLETNKDCRWSDEYYCELKQKYISIKKEVCYNFIPKPDRGYHQSGCFITTTVCEKLGFPDNCEILNTFRSFRENYLKKTPEGIRLLIEYDQIGPQISQRIANESPIYAANLMNTFLIPCLKFIKEKKYAEAISTYKQMVLELKATYNLMDEILDNQNIASIEELGKGRIRKKKNA